MKNSLLIGSCSIFSFFFIAISGLELLPLQNSPSYAVTALHLPPGHQDSILTRFAAWDTAFYVRLSLRGYQAGDDTTAFYPLWPLLLRTGSLLTGGGNPIIVGLVLANACLLMAIPLMTQLCATGPPVAEPILNENMDITHYFLVLFLCYPGTLFFNVPYTESLFLLLSASLLWSMINDRIALAALVAFLAPLARPVGCLLLLPICYWVVTERKSKWRTAVPIALLLGYTSYFVLMRFFTGNAFAGFEAQQMFPPNGSVARLLEPTKFLEKFLAIDSLHSMKGSLIDRVMILFGVIFTIGLYKTNRLLFWFAVPLVVIPAITNGCFSFVRFLAVVFPVFWQAAKEILSVGGRPLFYGTCLLFAVLKCLLILRLTNYFWAG